MARVNMNVDKNAGQYQPVPAGEYIVACVAVEDGVSKNSRRTQAILELEIEEGAFRGRKLGKYWCTFIPKGDPGHGLTVSCCKAFGLIQENDESLNIDTQDFRGRTARAELVIGEPNDRGTSFNEIGRWISPEAETKQAATPPARTAARQPAPAALRQAAPAAAAKVEDAPF